MQLLKGYSHYFRRRLQGPAIEKNIRMDTNVSLVHQYPRENEAMERFRSLGSPEPDRVNLVETISTP